MGFSPATAQHATNQRAADHEETSEKTQDAGAFRDCVKTPREGEKPQALHFGMTKGCLLIPMNCTSLFPPLPAALSSRGRDFFDFRSPSSPAGTG